MIKVLGILGSPRLRGNSSILLEEALKGAKEAGAETKLIQVSTKSISPCIGHDRCGKDGKCLISDDMEEVYEALKWADGVIIATPVYFGGVPAQLKALIDRTRVVRRGFQLAGKVGAAIIVGGRAGLENTALQLFDFYALHNMIVPGGATLYARAVKEGEIAGNEDALKAAYDLGKRLAEFCAKLKG